MISRNPDHQKVSKPINYLYQHHRQIPNHPNRLNNPGKDILFSIIIIIHRTEYDDLSQLFSLHDHVHSVVFLLALEVASIVTVSVTFPSVILFVFQGSLFLPVLMVSMKLTFIFVHPWTWSCSFISEFQWNERFSEEGNFVACPFSMRVLTIFSSFWSQYVFDWNLLEVYLD